MLKSQEESESQGPESTVATAVSTYHNSHYWLKHTETFKIDQRAPFYPCNHDGSCKDARCRCYNEQITCEKTCGCDERCERRFRGCSCAKSSKRMCFKGRHCECWKINRECDPDLCGACGAAEVLDPANRDNNDVLHGRCCNVGLQRNRPRRTLLGQSEISGFGLYAGEAIKRDEFVGEYKGEILSKEESNRRGAVYHYRATNYLFQLNKGNVYIEACYIDCELMFVFLQNKKLTVRSWVTRRASSTTPTRPRTSTAT